MAVRRIPVAALLLGVCAAANGQDPVPEFPPAARLAPPPGTAVIDPTAPAVPPLLVVPPPAVAPRKPCLPCHTEYQPSHVYLPEANPDYGAGGCDGECRPCRRYWVSLALLVGGSQDLGDIHRDLNCGIQGGAGWWFDDTKTLGVDVSVLNVHKPHHEIDFDTYINSPLTVTTADANVRLELLSHVRYRLDGLLGYRYAQLHEDLFVHSAAGFAAEDNTHNRINAGQIGLVGTYRFGGYFCEVLGKLGIGRNSESVSLNGVPVSDTVMTVIPEFGARVGYQLGEGVYGTVGYTFLYLNNVARPGRGDTDFYLHGFTIGMECRF
jgi:hypothetical protein